MGTAQPGAPVAIGDFVFDPETGEVRPRRGEGTGVRLAPQPARLLGLLIRNAGGLTTRDEIRDSLWPDSYVDFDQGVNFCIHQIRSALGDSGTEPAYVETLPRRGYRLMRSVEPWVGSPSGPPRRPPQTPGSRESISWLLAAACLAVLLVAAGLLALRPTPVSVARQRLAIMPFELAGPAGQPADLARISEWLVAEFTASDEGLEVVGPRSTAAYSAMPFPDLARLGEELAIDLVINARSFEEDGRQQLIVELIRIDDGSHAWAAFFTDTRSWQAIARQVHEHVAKALRAPP